MQTIVIGHKNPDMDSICAAVGYARLKQLLGVPNVIAARAGNTNARIDYVLGRFHVQPPVFLSDVSPRVADVMQRDAISVTADSAVYDAIQLIAEKQLRGLPVIDGNKRCLGLLSAFKLSHYLFPSREEASAARIINASLASIVKTFGGDVIAGEASNEASETLFMVGAMDLYTFSQRMLRQKDKKIVLFVGDREHIQTAAIVSKVRAIVVTGGLAVEERVLEAAKGSGVTIVSSPYDTATTVLLARGAVRADHLLEPFTSFSPETSLELARERAANSASFIFPIVDENGQLLGVLSKSDFLKPPGTRLILVDHNELSQAVQGADKVPITEILDHHRIGGFASDSPIHFWNNPVGSTSTIVALCYQQMGVPIPSDVAGLLMAGLISDTLNLTSPTATPVDTRVLDHLSKIANADPAELAERIFSVGSPLLTLNPDQVITADCKEYEEHGKRFTVSQIEELNFSHLAEKQASLLEALNRHCEGRGLFFAALLVTDINTQNSLLLVSGSTAFQQRITFPSHGPHIWELDGIVSRKKQLLPYLLQCMIGVGAG
ncbi:putative manganese-dependent inorganic diphosphatase [Pedosphaera parvula]|uniref:inorganic diphosphatase n=1 Tax=Pedosphaera parvula (strain Ellin514) TaxID=320771 RepID=B9XJ86_PEDPL|nr:putative manganese-dependent inorganic diphosphatase [Pedosphaera parvula]EEF60124.1 Inorganic diphosphatase [Pedosphaera parvula Ellin514]